MIDRMRMRSTPPPVVSFGTGGSGTRAIAAILHEAGIYLGPKLNRASDSLALEPFLTRWPEEYVTTTGWVDARGEGARSEPQPAMLEDLVDSMKSQREGIPSAGARWGWKAPRTIFVLPVIHHLFRDAYTVQLLRDGRDMAYSQNQDQLEALGPAMLTDLDPDTPQAVRSIALWSRLNVAAAAYGRRHLEGRHLVIRYEDLCGDPERWIARILAHLEVADPDPVIARAGELIDPSKEIGRWRLQDPDEMAAVLVAGAEGLSEFGYQ